MSWGWAWQLLLETQSIERPVDELRLGPEPTISPQRIVVLSPLSPQEPEGSKTDKSTEAGRYMCPGCRGATDDKSTEEGGYMTTKPERKGVRKAIISKTI